MKLTDDGINCLLDFAEMFIEEADAMSQPIYGTFHGGDPRNFSPDPECSTKEERDAHAKACELWDQGERPADPLGCEWKTDEEGKPLMHIMRSAYGLGVNSDPKMQELCHYVRQILEQRESEKG